MFLAGTFIFLVETKHFEESTSQNQLSAVKERQHNLALIFENKNKRMCHAKSVAWMNRVIFPGFIM
jgi:hypothetical protein